MKATILLAEDERDLAVILRDTLALLSYRVVIAADGQEALECYRTQRPDRIVADVMMPRMDGFTLVRTIRATDKHTPVIFLTARTETDDVVSGFKMGANDYLRKPFSIRELVVRIEALLDRTPETISSAADITAAASGTNTPTPSSTLTCGRFTLHPFAQRLVCDDNTDIALTHRESEILARLFAHPGEVVETRALLLSLWGSDTPHNVRSLHVFISKLRTYLAGDPHLRILNVHGIGYRLILD